MHLKEFSDRVIALGPFIRRPDLLKFLTREILKFLEREKENQKLLFVSVVLPRC